MILPWRNAILFVIKSGLVMLAVSQVALLKYLQLTLFYTSSCWKAIRITRTITIKRLDSIAYNVFGHGNVSLGCFGDRGFFGLGEDEVGLMSICLIKSYFISPRSLCLRILNINKFCTIGLPYFKTSWFFTIQIFDLFFEIKILFALF